MINNLYSKPTVTGQQLPGIKKAGQRPAFYLAFRQTPVTWRQLYARIMMQIPALVFLYTIIGHTFLTLIRCLGVIYGHAYPWVARSAGTGAAITKIYRCIQHPERCVGPCDLSSTACGLSFIAYRAYLVFAIYHAYGVVFIINALF